MSQVRTADSEISGDEWLARYILHKGYVRADSTVKPDAFIPYQRVELSVTRHRGLTVDGIWDAGRGVAKEVAQTLYGRADAQARVYLRRQLRVKATPLPGNSNHADVIGWPTDKPSQKAIALEIACDVIYRALP